MCSLKCADPIIRELKKGQTEGDRESFYLLAKICCPICQKIFAHRTVSCAVHVQEILERFFLDDFVSRCLCPNCKSLFCLSKESHEELLKEIKRRVKEIIQELKTNTRAL